MNSNFTDEQIISLAIAVASLVTTFLTAICAGIINQKANNIKRDAIIEVNKSNAACLIPEFESLYGHLGCIITYRIRNVGAGPAHKAKFTMFRDNGQEMDLTTANDYMLHGDGKSSSSTFSVGDFTCCLMTIEKLEIFPSGQGLPIVAGMASAKRTEDIEDVAERYAAVLTRMTKLKMRIEYNDSTGSQTKIFSLRLPEADGAKYTCVLWLTELCKLREQFPNLDPCVVMLTSFLDRMRFK